MGTRTPLVLAAVLIGVLISGLSLNELRRAMPQILHETTTAVRGGQPRDLDVQQARMMIEQGRLSNREAEQYRHLE